MFLALRQGLSSWQFDFCDNGRESLILCSRRSLLLHAGQMDIGDIPHVMLDFVVVGGLGDVLAGKFLVAVHFVIQAEIEVRVKESMVQFLAGRLPRHDGSQDVFRLGSAAVKCINLHHRHAAVIADLQDRLLRDR